MNAMPTPDGVTPSDATAETVGDNVSVWVVHEDGQTVVHVRGEVDMSTCEDLRDAIEPLLAGCGNSRS